ncbi:hypothetical protein CTI12_AA227800 [Artemisia annua]|uniref:non-specific serine/threonine protein kinase n=1 Tax=Artemisia annua TaxID=35608 RepID=A0A2U1NTH7_ARTAN|nr:hypothetical protein CTI12_AA227800 [Artemisia annua]
MSSRYGICEIVELEDEFKSSDRVIDKGKKPQGSNHIVDDINKLFEAINVRTSYHGLTPLSGGTTPRRNPSKRPMRMSTSSSYSANGYSEPVSLKQALRGLCISQASEMAALKRLSKPPGSPALSEFGKIANSYKSDNSSTFVGQVKEVKVLIPEENTSMAASSRTMPEYLQGGPKMKSSYNNSPQSSVQFNKKEKSPKRVGTGIRLNEILYEPESGNVLPMIESALHEKKCVAYDEPSKPVVNGSKHKPAKSVNKASFNLRRKGRLQSMPSSTFISSNKLGKPIKPIKTVSRNKNIVKKKSKQDLPSATSVIENVTFVPDTCQLVCERCHCALKEPNLPPCNSISTEVKHGFSQRGCGSNGSVIYNNTNFKYGDKSDFTQSSNSSSICEYSSSTSISEESSRCSIGNRPHMSMDSRRTAIHDMMKRNNGFLGLRHFNLLKKLGCGDIGTVYLAELVGTNLRYAIKVMDNEFLERRKKMPRAHTEREILRILDHPFLPTLYAHFVSDNLSCLVMDYCPGGDLHVLRQKQPGRYYHEQAARFYVAEVLISLEYLHMLGIVYRDLKPENILVQQDGHIKLTDFDLSLRCSSNPTILQSLSSGAMEPPRMSGPCAGSNCIDPFCIKPTCQMSCFSPRILPTCKGKKTKPGPMTHHVSLPQLVAEPTEARSNSFVGTHEYLAPEIIKGDGHGSAVDWWTFGIFLYELLYGRSPFKGTGNDETLANVVLQSLNFPDTPLVSFQARDLINGLLVKEPENRLGSQKGAAEIKQHPFFSGINWALIRCTIPPELPGESDIGMAKSASMEKATKCVDYNGPAAGGHPEFELF